MRTFYPRAGCISSKILTRSEIAAVLADLIRKGGRSPNARFNLVLLRLAVCCGLRATEIAKLQVGDIRLESTRPHVRIRRGASKGGLPRTVSLWWDAGTLADLTAWKATRIAQGANVTDPFLVSSRRGKAETVLSRHTLRKRFRTACKVLDKWFKRERSRAFSKRVLHGEGPVGM